MQRLQQSLKEQGFDAWLDTQRLTGGVVWSAEIESEIKTRQVVIALMSPGSYVSESCRAEQALDLIHGAMRLSSNVIARDPGQFGSQMVGRLLTHRDMPAIARFTDRIAIGTGVPWLALAHKRLEVGAELHPIRWAACGLRV